MESQNRKDRVEDWIQDVLRYRIEDKDKKRVLARCADIEAYGQEKNDSRLLGFAFFYQGEAYYAENKIEEMFSCIAKAVGYLNQSGQWELLARAYNLMAITLISKGNAPVALDYYLAGLRCCKEHGITGIVCSININVGFLYMQNRVYREAQRYFEDAYAVWCETKNARVRSLIMIYTNLATCYMLCGDLEKTEEYIEKIEKECEPEFTEMDYTYVECMKARYFHRAGKKELRDESISRIGKMIGGQIRVLDLFDDLYALCELAIEIERYDVLFDIIDQLEPIVVRAKMAYMGKKLLSLKIMYYQKNDMREEYVKGVSRFYELVRITEEESRKMISNMLKIRTSLERANESNAILTQKSETDQLTGLANRYRLTEYSENITERCLQTGEILSVEILDIDYFKQYNDNYGHQTGDECIRKIADCIKRLQNEKIFGARYGGDEFIIIYRGMNAEEVYEKADQLRQDILDLNLTHAYSEAAKTVTISQGICQDIPVDGNKSWDFLHVADNLLYRVKKKGRSSICIGNLHEEDQQVEL